MVGKITKSILGTHSPEELQRIYDKHPAKCRQWNAAFMINKHTPDSVKMSIAQKDAETYDAFTKFFAGSVVITAGAFGSSNDWLGESHLTTSRANFTLTERTGRGDLNSFYLDRCYPGFNALPFLGKTPEYEVCEKNTLPSGIYHSPVYGFIRSDNGNLYDSNRALFTSPLAGSSIKKIYTKSDLFEVFKEEEELFEKFANEQNEADGDVSKLAQMPETIIELIDKLFIQEEATINQEA
jgi:hypothetical protein